ncbi:hypothetical protein ACFSJW_02240 [Flavobacterium artemisiae]|uniref:Uncharacterized protein n=1 Tax=Flavobacterium artemisiae TaxID=2126556 RepID=A0ABW4HIK6_9FLAO
MKTLFKTVLLLVLLTALTFSCKKNENNNTYPETDQTDSMDMSVDTIGPAMDSTAVDSSQNGKTGTTGATGEGSTGSGTAGSTQKGSQSVRTDSVK